MADFMTWCVLSFSSSAGVISRPGPKPPLPKQQDWKTIFCYNDLDERSEIYWRSIGLLAEGMKRCTLPEPEKRLPDSIVSLGPNNRTFRCLCAGNVRNFDNFSNFFLINLVDNRSPLVTMENSVELIAYPLRSRYCSVHFEGNHQE